MFSQENLIIPLTSGMVSLTAGVELDSINMKGYDRATFLLQFDTALGTSDSHNPILTMETASSDSGDSADATFQYRVNSATTITTSADVWGSITAASTLTLTATTYAGLSLLLELNADDLPAASKTYEWVTVDISAESCSVGKVDAVAILSRPRYIKNVMPAANV